MRTAVEITAPSRLHFGLFSFGCAQGRQFGGVGAMIERPGVRLRLSAAPSLQVHGPHAERARAFALRFAEKTGRTGEPPCRIEVLSAPPQHVGLGLGTQLGLAVALGLDVLLDEGGRSAEDLARLVGRGERSAVGVHGFAAGGLIVERGKRAAEFLSPLAAARPIPPSWRFVLVLPQVPGGLHGPDERSAFALLPPVPDEVTRKLWKEVQQTMLPALEQADFDAFSQSVYRYGRLAGECFRAVQGGPYNGPLLNRLVASIRERGVAGVGQSSWGPTLFCLLPEEQAAEDFAARMRAEFSSMAAEYTISPPCNRGAQVEMAGAN